MAVMCWWDMSLQHLLRIHGRRRRGALISGLCCTAVWRLRGDEGDLASLDLRSSDHDVGAVERTA